MKENINWSQNITQHSYALSLEKGIFSWFNPKKIANSLAKSALSSQYRKVTSLQSAMSMLNFYINRAGDKLSRAHKEILMQAKTELHTIFNGS